MSDPLQLYFLGTGASVPSTERALPALAIRYQGMIILCDCGEGTQQQLLRAPFSSGKIEYIFISHLHGDHIYGLPGFLSTQQMLSRQRPLTIYGPSGITQYIDCIRTICHFQLTFPVSIIELDEHRKGDIVIPHFSVTCAALDHDFPVFGFRFQEEDKPGKFDAAKADALGIPYGPERSALQAGKPVTVEKGKTIQPYEIIGPTQKGRSICYCTDTRPCAASVHLARNSDVLIHDSTFIDDQRAFAQDSGHSTSAQAAHIAQKAEIKQLVLWHISSRYRQAEWKTMLKEAIMIFPKTVLPQDFDRLTVERS